MHESRSYLTEPLDGRQLRAFAALARTGSFTRTARELNLSQSAISHSMKALERQVRCRLLDKVGKSVTLTQAGEQLLAHANKILAEMQTARDRLSELGKWGHGRLRLCTSTTVCQYILPAVLREFKESFPQCVIHIEPGDTPNALELLRQHRIDLALTLEPREESSFEFHPWFDDELQFLVSPNHPWARTGKVERKEITRQRFILYTRTSYLHKMIDEYFHREPLEVHKSNQGQLIILANYEKIN